MEAAGMTDAELEYTIRNRQFDYNQYVLVRACADERETRQKCRFLDSGVAA